MCTPQNMRGAPAHRACHSIRVSIAFGDRQATTLLQKEITLLLHGEQAQVVAHDADSSPNHLPHC